MYILKEKKILILPSRLIKRFMITSKLYIRCIHVTEVDLLFLDIMSSLNNSHFI